MSPAIAAPCASRGSAANRWVSPTKLSDAGLAGVTTIAAMRTRTGCAELVTDVGVPFNTARAVMSVAPNRTPDTRPLAETTARVVSTDTHSNVTPLVTVVVPDFAVAVSWRVPFKKTVESPLTTTDVIVGGPPPPPSPPPHPTSNPTPISSRLKRFMMGLLGEQRYEQTICTEVGLYTG